MAFRLATICNWYASLCLEHSQPSLAYQLLCQAEDIVIKPSAQPLTSITMQAELKVWTLSGLSAYFVMRSKMRNALRYIEKAIAVEVRMAPKGGASLTLLVLQTQKATVLSRMERHLESLNLLKSLLPLAESLSEDVVMPKESSFVPASPTDLQASMGPWQLTIILHHNLATAHMHRGGCGNTGLGFLHKAIELAAQAIGPDHSLFRSLQHTAMAMSTNLSSSTFSSSSFAL